MVLPAFASVEPITTQISCSPNCTAVPVGTPLIDNATIAGVGTFCTFTSPEGSAAPCAELIFNVYQNGACTGDVFKAVLTSYQITANGNYLSDSFTPTSPGTYAFYVTFSNENGSPSGSFSACEPFTVVPPTSTVPQFPVGLVAMVAILAPALLFLKSRRSSAGMVSV